MDLILGLRLELRLAGLFVFGLLAGSLANLGIYRLAWHPRAISPWSRPDPKAPPRRLTDRLPVFGWLGLRREAGLHGTGFWIRPLLLELLAGIGLAALYWWEIHRLGLLPPDDLPRGSGGPLVVLHTQYAAHVALIWLMLVASVIDVDEKTIPDAITLPGTLLGLVLAAACPWSMLYGAAAPLGFELPPAFRGPLSPQTWPFLQLTSPRPLRLWPPPLSGLLGLVIGLGCWWLWGLALTPRTWYPRHGYRRALQLCLARMLRESATYQILRLGAVGSLALTAAWLLGGRSWIGLLSALVGMAASGALVWMVRVIGAATLKKEAMGFGDVTLMAMIGAFLGWQTCLIVFFLAPLAGLVVGLAQVVLLRDSRIPYGPFLCLATLVTVVGWAEIWSQTRDVFGLGWIVPLMLLVCLALMGGMLGLWSSIRDLFR